MISNSIIINEFGLAIRLKHFNKICKCYRPNMYKDNIDRCFGTKEIDPCNCKGNKYKCDAGAENNK